MFGSRRSSSTSAIDGTVPRRRVSREPSAATPVRELRLFYRRFGTWRGTLMSGKKEMQRGSLVVAVYRRR